jgi:hypothetical protein
MESDRTQIERNSNLSKDSTLEDKHRRSQFKWGNLKFKTMTKSQ